MVFFARINLKIALLDDLGLTQAIVSECNNFTRVRQIPVTSDVDNTTTKRRGLGHASMEERARLIIGREKCHAQN
jgi:hypothetical protein